MSRDRTILIKFSGAIGEDYVNYSIECKLSEIKFNKDSFILNNLINFVHEQTGCTNITIKDVTDITYIDDFIKDA